MKVSVRDNRVERDGKVSVRLDWYRDVPRGRDLVFEFDGADQMSG